MIQKGRSKTLTISDLGAELGELRTNLNKRLQGKCIGDVTSFNISIFPGLCRLHSWGLCTDAYLEIGHHRRTQRGGSHRTSFIEYVSEVYNARRDASGGGASGMAGVASNLMDALSVRGQSISSGSEVSRASSALLARELSVRSESVAGGPPPGPTMPITQPPPKRLSGRSNTTRNRSKGAF